MKGPVRDPSTFTFNATAKTVTFSAPIPASQQQILGILNVTRQAWLYLPVQANYGGTWASPTLTLTASTTGHANGDVLQIFVDDGLATTAVTAAALPLPSGAATAANQATANTSLASLDGKLPALASGRIPVDIGSASISIGASVEVSNDAGNPLPVSGSVSISGTPTVTGPLTDTELRATAVSVSGPLTDTQLRATAVPVSGTFWQTTQPISGSVSISGTPTVTGPLTDTQLRATAVPVSGTFWQATQPVSAASLPLPAGAATAAKQPTFGTAGAASSDVITVQGIASGVALPVSGNVTANAGTNLNTSALALESGGNLASINTKMPAQGLAQPSASRPVVLPQKVVVTGTAGLSALNTNLLTGNLSDWSDASGYSSVLVNVIQSAGISAGAFTFEGSPDGTQVINLGYMSITSASGYLLTGPTVAVANGVSSHFAQLPYRYWRVRVSTAITGGTVQAIATYSNALQMPIGQSVVTPFGVSLSANIAQINASTAISSAINGGTSVALGVLTAAGVINTETSGTNVAAVSGSTASPTNASNSPCLAFDVNLTAFTAGSSTGLDIYLQESPDNGTTWYDIWQCEALTAVGRARIPALPVNGRRRFRWVNRTGAATTATLTINSTGTPAALLIQRQFFDRTSGVGSGTAVISTNSAAYDIAGCKALSVVMQAGTATAAASFQVQMSMDGSNWYTASAATAIGATTANNTVIPVTSGVAGRFIRVTCTAAGTAQVINAIHIYGMN